MPYSPMDSLRDFHETFSPDQREQSLFEKVERRGRLIDEEAQEVMEALDYLDRTDAGFTSATIDEAMAELAGELADLLYVVYGTAEELGIPLQEVFKAVHSANMRKVWDDGQVHRNEFGKVIKPPNFEKADIRKVIQEANMDLLIELTEELGLYDNSKAREGGTSSTSSSMAG